MKTTKTIFFALLLGMLLMSNSNIAQEDKSYIITVTTLHWNMGLKNFSKDDWIATEKEYLDKVVKKNPLIIGQEVMTHYFTSDNTEILLVTTYANWGDIEKARAKDDELVKSAWSDEKARTAYFEKKNNYYAPHHSDEIYQTMPGAKIPKGSFNKDMVCYVRVGHFAFQKNGTLKDFNDLQKQYNDAVTNKNDLIKAYYPNRHAWGADNTQYTEVFMLESLADLEKTLDKNKELFTAAWKDEAKRKEYSDKMGDYFTGVHGDYIYKTVHELTK